jgi:hypothetical protein
MYHLGEHLMVLYGRGQLGLDDDGRLLRRFLGTTNPEIRRHAICFVGESLDGDEKVPEVIAQRFMTLWDVYWAGPGKQDTKESPNAALFGTWFACGKFPEPWALDRLQRFVEETPTPEPAHEIAEKLEEIAHVDIAKSVRILDVVIRGDRDGWRIHAWLDSAKRILELAVQAPGEACNQAVALIDHLGRRGYTQFGQLLSQIA